MEQVSIAILISIVSVAFSIFFGLKNTQRTDSKDLEQRIRADERINMKLDEISRNCNDTRSDLTGMKDDIKRIDHRLVKAEQSAKSAHKRIDGILGVKYHGEEDLLDE